MSTMCHHSNYLVFQNKFESYIVLQNKFESYLALHIGSTIVIINLTDKMLKVIQVDIRKIPRPA